MIIRMSMRPPLSGAIAPEPILRAALHVTFVAAYTTRNWSLDDQVSRRQINDLWESIHNVPDLVCRWRDDAARELLLYFNCYDERWPEPKFRKIYEDALREGTT